MIFSSFLFGVTNATWYTPGTVTTTLKAQDVNGTTITLGSTVKIVGTVIAIDLTSPHFDNITVQAIHPGGDVALNPAASLIVKVYPLNLVVGQ